MGPEVYELEQKLSDYVGVKHTISCANGTDALSLALMALNIKEGDAVFCPTFTFFATAEAIALTGATPVFVDSNKNTFNICTIDLENRVKKIVVEGKLKPKAIIAVNLFGLPADYITIQKITKKYELKLIEDAAQGFGGEIHTKRAGSFGDISTTSFFPAKPLGCYGDGGALFTNNDEYAELLKSYRQHGKGKNKYDNVRIGMNSRLDTIQAAILLEKLKVFPQELLNRNILAKQYTAMFKDKLSTPFIPNGYLSSWAQYTLISKKRDKIVEEYKAKNIPTMIYYAKCLHQQKAFINLGYNTADFPVAKSLAKTVFSLPMHGYMSDINIKNISFNS